jgi:hypothetical protein
MPRPSTPPDPGKVLEAALDVFVYAPIGFALDAREVVPKLVERGRNQVALARLFGKYALMRGQSEAERILNAKRAAAPAPSTPAAKPAAPAPAPASEPHPPPPPPTQAEAPSAPTAPTAKARTATTVRPARPATTTAAAKALPIPGYDSLSASQVVPRLDALRKRELEAVRVYEAAHRGRRTILNRIAQLQG